MVGCKSNQQKAGMAESNAKPTVTVTIPPYQYFVDKIAGDKVDVNVMVSMVTTLKHTSQTPSR